MTHVLHVHTTICKECQRINSSTQLYEVESRRAGYRHLIPATGVPAFRPEIVHLPMQWIGVCLECASQLPEKPELQKPFIPLSWRAKERLALTSTKPRNINNPLDLEDIA